MKFLATILFTLLIWQSLPAQNMWMWNQRTHPELEWQTLETDHFRIHFHLGLEDIARKGASIAEQTYQPIMDQLQMADFGKTDIVFSAEDEIMNGFAMPSDQIFIWVSQNDVAGQFGGSEKWLKLVITHEFQHVVQFRAQQTWVGVLSRVSVPHWWYEGMAEYMTEVWRVGRSDSQMKIHTYRNSLGRMDPHDDGYAKVLYLAWKYGDSSLVNISKHRLYLDSKHQSYPFWYDFGTAFKKVTGQSLSSFNEEWRRVMNTYYYGVKAQKEREEDVGKPFLIPGFASFQSASVAADSSKIAVIGRRDKDMQDVGLYVLNTHDPRDTREIHFGSFSGDPDWSPDASGLVISEYHRGEHGSLIFDIRRVNAVSGKKHWLTENLRAHHPIFSRDGKGVFYVAHPGETSQIYYQELSTNRRIQLSQFSGDVQVRDLDLSVDGQRLCFAIQEENGDVNIAVMAIDGRDYHKVTLDPEEDLFPVWSPSGKIIIFTSYRSGIPNLYRIDLDSLTLTRMTDVAGGITSRQRLPGTNRVLAATLGDMDTVRIRSVPMDRTAPIQDLAIQPAYEGWRLKRPDIQLPEIRLKQDQITTEAHSYSTMKSIRPLARLIWPDVEGLFGMAIYMDALGKHVMQGGAVLGWDGRFQGGYMSYLNLSFKPAIHVFGSKDLAYNLRHSFDQLFVEKRNGVGLSLELPMNSGYSLSSNHSIRLSIQGLQRDLQTAPSLSDALSEDSVSSSSSSELNLGLTYSWKSQRPRRDQYFLPRDGKGFLVHFEATQPELYGDNKYSQVWTEGFINLSVPQSPVTFYTRLKWIKQGGTILSQDAIGFSETAPIYVSNAYWSTLRGIGLFDTPESYSLRGQVAQYPARELVYSVNELRMPLLRNIPVNVLGLGFQNLTAAVFLDLGYLPETQVSLSTYGAELKFDLSFMKFSLITLAAGFGGDADYWKQDSEKWHPYLRLALVNPF